MGNSIGKLGTIAAMTAALTLWTGEKDKNKPVDLTVDGLNTAVLNLLSNEAYAATLEWNNIQISKLNVIWDAESQKVLKLVNWLNISENAKKELIWKIEEIVSQWKDRMTSYYDKETNQEFSISYIRWKVEIIDTKGEKPNNWTKTGLTTTHSIDNEWNKITKYEQDGKWFELKEVWNDAIITYFWFSGWHREWDEEKWVKSADRFSANAMLSAEITNNISLWAWVKVWPEQFAFLAFTLIDFGKFWQVVLFWENYRENNTFNTSIWEKKAWEEQEKIALLLRKEIGDWTWIINSVELEWSYTKWEDTKVFSEQSTVSNTTVTDTPESTITRTTTTTSETTWTSIGWEKLQAVLSAVLKISENQKLTLWAQVTDREYNDWIDLGTKVGWVIWYEAIISELNKLKLGVSADETEQRYTAWIYRKVWDNGEIWVSWYYNNTEEWKDNYGAMLWYTHRFATGWKINDNKQKGYKLFSENGEDINEVAMNFAQKQASQSIDTPSKYVEEKKQVSSVTIEDVRNKPKANPETPVDNIDNFTNKELTIWETYDTGFTKSKFSVSEDWIVSINNWVITWLKKWTVNVTVDNGKKKVTRTMTVKEWGTPPNPELPLPTSSFASSSVSKTVWDAPFTNAFTTNSSWAITYSSSNTAVATVNATTWEVTIVWNWTATITANQAATASFKADTDTFSLTVNNVANTPPTVSNITSSWDLEFGTQITNIWLNISDDDLSKVSWTLSVTSWGWDWWSFSQSSGTWNTLNWITFTATNWFQWGRTIKVTINDSWSGSSNEYTIYSN